MTLFYYKFSNNDKWIQVSGDGKNPSKVKNIKWKTNEGNTDLEIIKNVISDYHPGYGSVLNYADHPRNLYILANKFGYLSRSGYKFQENNFIPFDHNKTIIIKKTEKTISVKGTSKRKAHKRTITFEGKKPEIKDPVIDYKDLSTKILEYESTIKSQLGGERIIETVEEYTAAEYMFINEYIKTGIILPFPSGMKFKESKIKEKINDIETFIKDAPKHKGIVYRGMKFPKEGEDPIQQFNKFVNGMEIASEYTIKQFTSSSVSKDTAMNFSMDKENYGILFKIKSKNGVYLNGLSLIPEEKEVLFNKETKFKILGIDRSNPQNVQITMEEI